MTALKPLTALLTCVPKSTSLYPALMFLLASLTAPWAGAEFSVFATEAPERLKAYIQIDTINPPGNESNGAAFFATHLEAAGIEYWTGESAPGRGNLWAKLPGTGKRGDRKPGLVLLNHMDVVPANEKYWSVDPYAGVEQDGYIFGRGAVDMKGLGLTQFQAFLALADSGRKLNRDVWFIATADEEAGGFFGAGWLIEQHPEIFRGVGFLLNEGGSGRLGDEDTIFAVEVTQKVPLWLRLRATGRPGHGSAPQVETAVTRLLRAGHRITTTGFSPRALDPVQAMFKGIASLQQERFRPKFEDIGAHVQDSEFMLALQLEQPGLHALLRNTCSATMLEGSSKINVVPAEAFMELDCRLLPDQDVERFVAELERLIADPNIRIERIMNFTPAISRADTRLFREIESVTAEFYPGSRVVQSVSTGFTDSHFFRDLGIVAYGFGPFIDKTENFRGVHGNDEKISVDNVIRGTEIMIRLLEAFTTD